MKLYTKREITNLGRKHIQYWNRATKKYARDLRDTKADIKTIYQPAIDEKLDDVYGKRILDASCGESYQCKEFASQRSFVTGLMGLRT